MDRRGDVDQPGHRAGRHGHPADDRTASAGDPVEHRLSSARSLAPKLLALEISFRGFGRHEQRLRAAFEKKVRLAEETVMIERGVRVVVRPPRPGSGDQDLVAPQTLKPYVCASFL